MLRIEVKLVLAWLPRILLLELWHIFSYLKHLAGQRPCRISRKPARMLPDVSEAPTGDELFRPGESNATDHLLVDGKSFPQESVNHGGGKLVALPSIRCTTPISTLGRSFLLYTTESLVESIPLLLFNITTTYD